MTVEMKTNQLRFVSRGKRRRPDSGLSYRCVNGPYVVYCSDQVAGIKVKPVRWLAIVKTQAAEQIISRHRCRAQAEKACHRHFSSKER